MFWAKHEEWLPRVLLLVPQYLQWIFLPGPALGLGLALKLGLGLKMGMRLILGLDRKCLHVLG